MNFYRVSILFVVSVAIAAISQSAGAGWISSGGENFVYAKNPWFVKNTMSVDYCVEMDEAAFSISRADTLQLITEAFEYWKGEFGANFSSVRQGQLGFTEIAKQKFQYQPQCLPKIPLVFKFGAKTLDAEETKELVDPSKFIGVAIRKEYSLEQLKAEGIIYISGDLGPDAYGNLNGLLIDQAWKHPELLRYALIHELGHLFGIPHVGAGIMSEVFMTVLLNKSMAPEFVKTPQQRFLNPPRDFEVCRLTGQFNPDFFKISPGTQCLKFAHLAGSTSPQWTVYARADLSANDVEIGTVHAGSLDQSPYSLKPAVIVQLPETQKVFSAAETLAGPYLIGAVFSDASYSGTFRQKGQIRAIPVHMTLAADKVSFVGTVSNQQMTVMNYAPLSFLKAIFP